MSASEFTHVVLTRFNTAVGYAPSALRLDTEWLRRRLELFEQYCLPSIAEQRDVLFQWIVFCDAESPEWFRARMAAYGPLLTPLYIAGRLNDRRIASSVAEGGFVHAPYLITTRLDNDDAIAVDHLKNVQAKFQHQNREFVEFPLGIQSFRGHLYSVYWPSNPFLSLIERVREGSQFTTVCCAPHDQVRSAWKVRSVLRSPQWLQVLHGENLENGLRGWPRLQSHTHPNFRVVWPESNPSDSLAQRVGYTAAAYSGRAKRRLVRHAESA